MKSPQRYPARAVMRSFDEYSFVKDSRYASQQKSAGLLIRRRDLACPFRHHQAISDSELGQEYPRLGRVDLDLLPKLAHEDAQIMRVVQMGRPPHLLEQELVGDDVAGVLRQPLPQPIFLRGERPGGGVRWIVWQC